MIVFKEKSATRKFKEKTKIDKKNQSPSSQFFSQVSFDYYSTKISCWLEWLVTANNNYAVKGLKFNN